MKKLPVIILCGGKGSRLSEETAERPKPMVEIGDRPILWHIMKHYASYGHNHFILALGYKADYIKNYFYNYPVVTSDFTITMDTHDNILWHNVSQESDWKITLVDTGLETLKGGRIKKLEQYVKCENFFLTYGDAVASIDLDDLQHFHTAHNLIGTVSAVRPPSRFGMLSINEQGVVDNFEEKPQLSQGYINGGFFVFNKKIFNYLSDDENCDFEFGPLQKLSDDRQMKAYTHDGFWQCMDTLREKKYLNSLVIAKKAPWIRW